MKKLGIVLLVVALTLALGLMPMASVSAAGEGGATAFVTGGGNIKEGGEVIWTFGGNVGLLEDGTTPYGQFQIVNHIDNVSWHCGDFTDVDFSGDSIEGPPGPSAGCSVVTFTGTFTSNSGDTAILTVVITDVYEPGKDNDTISVSGDFNFSGNPISGGNFQMHKGASGGGNN